MGSTNTNTSTSTTASACDHDHDCDHPHVTANDGAITGTKTLHDRGFAPAMAKRFQALKGAIRTTVGYDLDYLRLSQGNSRARSRHLTLNRRRPHVTANAPDDIGPPNRPFTLRNHSQAADEFVDWLAEQLDAGVLESMDREFVYSGQHYTAQYVHEAYEKGVANAGSEMANAGMDVDPPGVSTALQLPVHRDTLEQIYSRTYDNLDGITTDTARAIRRELTQGLAEGRNPRRIASSLNDLVENVGLTRARTLSRTEISNAHNTASARRYARLGVEEVDIVTANPCNRCASLAASNPYPIDEAASLIPGRTHPNCMCAIVPHTAY